MPLDLHNLQANTATCRLDYGPAGDLNIVYRPGNLTERAMRDLALLDDKSIMGFDENMAALNNLLLRVVVSWDLTNNGETVPLTAEALTDVPLDIRTEVLRAVMQGTRLDPKMGTVSPADLPATSERKVRTSSKRRT